MTHCRSALSRSGIRLLLRRCLSRRYGTQAARQVTSRPVDFEPPSSVSDDLTTRLSERVWAALRRPELDFDFLLDSANLDAIRQNVARRKQVGDVDKLHATWRRLQTESDVLGIDELTALWDELHAQAARMPNRTHPHVPVGGAEAARVLAEFGERPSEAPTGSKRRQPAETVGRNSSSYRADVREACGDRAYALVGPWARLDARLVAIARDALLQRGFDQLLVPDVLPTSVADGCGFGATGAIYRCRDEADVCLAGTGEMGIADYLSDSCFDAADLPLRYFAVSRCYRPETGTGRAAHGLYRVHDFTKVEMFGVTADETAKESDQLLAEFCDIQRDLFTSFGLFCRQLEMPTQELGAAAYRKVDVEAWLPARGVFGEISSATNCTDFQSRRLAIRYRRSDGSCAFAHTINATAAATSRLILAIVETSCQLSNTPKLPEILQLKGGHKPARFKALHVNPHTTFSAADSSTEH